MINKTWTFLSSIRLALALLIILTVISVAGIVVPQGLLPEQYLNKLGGFWGNVILKTGMDRLFSTVWFYSLLGVLSINILSCIFTRLWSNVARAMDFPFLASAADAGLLKHSFSCVSDLRPQAAVQATLRALKAESFRVRANAEGTQICAKKGSLKEYGSFLLHFSLILLFAGGLMGKFGGYSVLKELGQGEVSPVRDRNFLVRADWFKIETNEKGQVKDYKSQLTLLRPDSSLIVTKVIEVNYPLTHEGVRFYQASYGMETGRIQEAFLRLNGPGLDSAGVEGRFPFDSAVVLQGPGMVLRVTQFLGDFVMDTRSRQPYSRSREHDNPAVKVALTRGADTLMNQWIFQRYPDVHMGEGPYKAAFLDYTPLYYSGIQVKRSPGSAFIWLGILLMSFGIITVFWVSKRSVWVFVAAKGAVSEITVGGRTDNPASLFNGEFEALCRAIREQTGKGGN